MKLSEFKKPAPRADVSPDPAPEGMPKPQEPQGVTTVTPSGIEIEYQWAPRRLYRLRGGQNQEPFEVPSVTTVLDVLDKSGPLVWWSQKTTIESLQELADQGETRVLDGTADDVVARLTEHKMTVNHKRDKAADRGVNVHGALEQWVESGLQFHPDDFAEHEKPYIEGLVSFLVSLQNNVSYVEAELMVGSLEHQYAGRFDLVLTLSKPVEVVTRVFPKKPPKVEEIPAGRYLLDLKTSKRVYDTHFLQLEAYEAAAIECGYAPTDYRGVVHVTEDGRYELALNEDWCFEDFLAVRRVYTVLNEREVLRILREDLDAQEVK